MSELVWPGDSRIQDIVDLETLQESVMLLSSAFGAPQKALVSMLQGRLQLSLVRDFKPLTTHGGSSVSGIWQIRDLNQILLDETGEMSLNSNILSVPVGQYLTWATAPCFRGLRHRLALWDMGTSPYIIMSGGNAHSNEAYSVGTTAHLFGVFDAPVDGCDVALQHYVESGFATMGLGVGGGGAGVGEVYAQLLLCRLKDYVA